MAELLKIDFNPLLTIMVNTTTVLFFLPRKKNLLVTIALFLAVMIGLVFFEETTGLIKYFYNIPGGLVFLPLIILLFQGTNYKKIFLFFMQMIFTISISLFIRMTIGFFVPYDSYTMNLLMFITVPAAYAVYLIYVFKYGKQFLDKLFSGGTKSQWLLYILSAIVSFSIVIFLRIQHSQNNILHYCVLLFIILSIADYDLCIVIGNLLENAVAASQNLKSDRKFNLDMMIHNEQFVLEVENNFSDEVVSKDTAVKEGGGLGLRSVRLVIEKYGGQIFVKNDGGMFTVSVIM